MDLDTSMLEHGVSVNYVPQLPRFRRHFNKREPLKTRIVYHFGFPRINRTRFATIDIYDKASQRLPNSVVEYFSEINDDSLYAYLFQFYPNGYPTTKNAELIRGREGNGAGTAGFRLIREDLAKLKVRNAFITPTSERMVAFLERKGFEKINEARPWPGFPLTISMYGIVFT